jgi:hypothetical protein
MKKNYRVYFLSLITLQIYSQETLTAMNGR